MSNRRKLPVEVTHEVRDNCYCLHLQRAARATARRYDDALRPLGLTSGQFSLLMSLNRAEPPTMGEVASLLAMDRTTLTANLKPLERRGLVELAVDPADRRSRRLLLSEAGRAQLIAALPVWRRTQKETESVVPDSHAERLRADLTALGGGPTPTKTGR
jgi:DNA-binding MarR family transcriptional regulator